MPRVSNLYLNRKRESLPFSAGSQTIATSIQKRDGFIQTDLDPNQFPSGVFEQNETERGIKKGNISKGIDHSNSLQLTPIFTRAKELIKRHEGFRAKPYTDTTGHLTIGYGTNLAVGITQKQAEKLLEVELEKVEREAREIFSNWEELPEQVKLVVLDMIYNLGKGGFLKFKKMVEAIHRQEWEKMAKEMKDSLWCRQVKNRCRELVQLVSELFNPFPDRQIVGLDGKWEKGRDG